MVNRNVLVILQTLYMFLALAITCDEYFVTSLEKICEVQLKFMGFICEVHWQCLFNSFVSSFFVETRPEWRCGRSHVHGSWQFSTRAFCVRHWYGANTLWLQTACAQTKVGVATSSEWLPPYVQVSSSPMAMSGWGPSLAQRFLTSYASLVSVGSLQDRCARVTLTAVSVCFIFGHNTYEKFLAVLKHLK